MTPAEIIASLAAIEAHAALVASHRSAPTHILGGCRASASRRRAQIPVVLGPGRVASAHTVLREVVPDPRLALGWPTDSAGVPLLPRDTALAPTCERCARIVGRS